MGSHDKQQSPLCVMLTSTDVPKSVAYYRDVLGFTMKECWPEGDNPMWANMVLDGQSIMLGCAMDPEQGAEECAAQGASEDEIAFHTQRAKLFAGNAPGAGAFFYVAVPDVDAYHATITKNGGKPHMAPKSQFYGIRDFAISDPDGYVIVPYATITMSSCQSCAMPLSDAQPGQMYCEHCVDENGQLRPYEQILEGTISGYFMGMQKMERAEAETAAKEHLSKQPAWMHAQV